LIALAPVPTSTGIEWDEDVLFPNLGDAERTAATHSTRR